MQTARRPPQPPLTAIARRLPAAVFMLHGMAHLVGTAAALAALRAGESLSLVIGEASSTWGLRGLMWAWAIVAAGYVGVAVAEWVDDRRWRIWLFAVTVASLVLVITALPATWIGLIIDGVILGWLGRRP